VAKVEQTETPMMKKKQLKSAQGNKAPKVEGELDSSKV
jgi:hypothetical protein